MKQRSRGQIIPRGTNRFLLRVYLGRNSKGQRQYSSKTVLGTRQDAGKELIGMLRALDTQTFTAPSKMTVKEALDAWLKTKTDVVPKTLRSYESLLETHVYPTLGGSLLSALSPMRAQTLFTALASSTRDGATDPLSPRTVQYVHAVLSMGLDHCCRMGLIQKNPCEYITLPRMDRPEPQILDDQQITRLLAIAQEPWRTLWIVALGTGLRPQEYLALTWADLVGQTLVVSKAMREMTPGHYAPADMKTKSSRRTVAIGPELVNLLLDHRKRTGGLAGPMFRSRAGTALDITNVRKHWYADLERAELPKVNLYSTRHTHISALLSARVNPRAVADRAGHSTVKMTLDRYAKAMPQEQEAIAEQTDVLLFQRRQA